MSNLMIALEITALGMGLVFATIILLWWIMVLLTFITAEKETEPPTIEPVSIMDNEAKARAAALAVAFALAQQETALAHPLSDPPTAIVSAWQLGTRTRQLYQKGERIKRQTRKIGS